MSAVTADEPKVGIFWLLEKRLIYHSTPLSSAEKYGDCLTSPVSHIDHWANLQQRREVSGDVEYEEPPRGRVVYDCGKQQFTIYADRCIIRRGDAIHRIITALGLSQDVKIASDDHYRCYRCLYHSRRSA